MTTTRESVAAGSVPAGSGALGPRGSWLSRSMAVVRYHWLATLLIAIGAALRVITWMAYHPAIFYIDSVKYLYHGWQGSDPLGYKVPLKIILAIGNLGTFTALQHLLGIAIAVALYALLVRRGVNRWLAALAIAPILLDGYQLQAEATIMPDVLFEGMVVAGICVLLWKPTATWLTIMVSGLIFGLSATVREVGLWTLAPAVLFLLGSRWLRISRDDWYGAILKSCVLSLAFLVPVVAYCGISYDLSGHFQLSVKGSAAGRMAYAADCATLKLPAKVRPLCPPPAMQKESPDWLEHSGNSSLIDVKLPSGQPMPGPERVRLVSEFDHAVERQQPLRVIVSVLRDSVRLFDVQRKPTISVTPIARWQFQPTFPQYDPEFMTCPLQYSQAITPLPPSGATDNPFGICARPGASGDIIVGIQQKHSSPWDYVVLKQSDGGKAEVDHSLATFLRAYQLDGGFTPGPLLLAFTIAGLLGSVIALVFRRGSARQRNLAVASLVFFVTALGLLLVADVYVFSWRYQLQALVTLPPAGALGASALIEMARSRRRAAQPAAEAEPAPAS